MDRSVQGSAAVPPGQWECGAGPLKAIMPATLMIVPAPRSCMPATAAREHRGREDLHVHEFRGLAGLQFGQRHVVGDAGVPVRRDRQS